MTPSNEDIQRALVRLGYDIGKSGKNKDGVDGVPGRLTLAAIKALQKKNGLPGSGIPGPKTFALLGLAEDAGQHLEPPWMAIARSKVGMHEIRDNKSLRAFLKSDGNALGDPSKLPWCGDFVETCVALALPDEPIRPTTHNNPYWAKNWEGFGLSLAEPSPGAILVFGRDGGGHVAFYVGEDGPNYIVLGGNQGNAVSIMKIAKSRLLARGIRWPTTFARPTRGPVKLSLAVAQSQNEA